MLSNSVKERKTSFLFARVKNEHFKIIIEKGKKSIFCHWRQVPSQGRHAQQLMATTQAINLCTLTLLWDFIDRQTSWTQGSNEITLSNTDNITVGMKVSSGRSFSAGTKIKFEFWNKRTASCIVYNLVP